VGHCRLHRQRRCNGILGSAHPRLDHGVGVSSSRNPPMQKSLTTRLARLAPHTGTTSWRYTIPRSANRWLSSTTEVRLVATLRRVHQYPALTSRPFHYPAFGTKGSLVIWSFMCVAQLMMTASLALPASRQAFAFARDGALPFSNYWYKVDKWSETPVRSECWVVSLSLLLRD
jgi:hypothetical protein